MLQFVTILLVPRNCTRLQLLQEQERVVNQLIHWGLMKHPDYSAHDGYSFLSAGGTSPRALTQSTAKSNHGAA